MRERGVGGREGGREGGRQAGCQELAKSIIWTYIQTDRQKSRKLFICSYCVLLSSPPYSRTRQFGPATQAVHFLSFRRSMKHAVCTVSTAVHTGTSSPQPPSQQQVTASPLLISDVRIHGRQFYFGKKACYENGSCDPQILLLKSLPLS
jgi:hypothetical protein